MAMQTPPAVGRDVVQATIWTKAIPYGKYFLLHANIIKFAPLRA